MQNESRTICAWISKLDKHVDMSPLQNQFHLSSNEIILLINIKIYCTYLFFLIKTVSVLSYINFRLVLFVSLTIDDSGDAFPYFTLLGNMDVFVTMARRSSLVLLPCGLGVRAYLFVLLTTVSGTSLVVVGIGGINLMDLPSFWDNFSYGLVTVIFVRRDGDIDRLILMVDGIYKAVSNGLLCRR